ncbi:hypothetical protein KEJ18_05200 [Candidatus Bathyarchaeota archaeon]|nr:hypothetical protein [Candidatus Bathyarchaeota archaeon]
MKAKAIAFLMASMFLATVTAVPVYAKGGFDQFGYNYQARIFVGKADGVDRVLDGAVWGDPTYANDHLVMKWSKAWDDARFHGAPWTPEAWCTNEWNGAFEGGSGEVWHYKIIWVGPELEDSTYWREGGYPVWGQFEVIMDQGTVDGKHIWGALATPNGLGGP